MISKGLKITLVALVVIAGSGTFVGFRFANAQLRPRLDALRQGQAEGERLREANERTRVLLAKVSGSQDAAASAIQAEVNRLRSEVAGLEILAVTKAAERSAQVAAEAEALATNRDPSKGLTRLEHFQNLGQATPGAAFQTLGWAALKGDATVLTQVSVISAPARAKAEAMIARLPENVRAQWTPEKLAAMFFTGALGEVTAAQVMTETPQDSQHVASAVRITGDSKEDTIHLRWELGANGWQVVFDEKMLGGVQKHMANAEAPPPKK